MLDVFIDALLDSLKVLGVLVVLNILISLAEGKAADLLFRKKKYTTLVAVGMAVLPQCGFSVLATDLYQKRKLTAGALIGVYIATSDEALPILIANPEKALSIIPLILIKVLVGVGAAFLIDFVFKEKLLSYEAPKPSETITGKEEQKPEKKETPSENNTEKKEVEKPADEKTDVEEKSEYSVAEETKEPENKGEVTLEAKDAELQEKACSEGEEEPNGKGEEEEKPREEERDEEHHHDGEEEHCEEHRHDGEEETPTIGCCNHHVTHGKKQSKKEILHSYLLHPLVHSLKIFAYVLAINMVFGVIIYYVGEERLIDFLETNKYLAPLFAVVIGVIPNCAASVILTNMYVLGGIGFGACIGGLTANAGLGLVLLFKKRKDIKTNLIIVGLLLGIAIVVGYVTSIFQWFVF